MRRGSLSAVSPQFWTAWTLVFITALVFLKAASLIPLEDLTTSAPLQREDLTAAWADIVQDRRLERTGRFGAAYDTSLWAGHPGGVFRDHPSRAYLLADRALRPWADPARTVKWLAFLFLALSPICVYAAARLLGLERVPALLAYAFAAAGLLHYAYVHWDAAFVAAAHVAVLAVAFLARFAGSGRWRWYGGLAASLLAVSVLHLPAFVAVSVACVAASFALRRSGPALSGWTALAVAVACLPHARFFLALAAWRQEVEMVSHVYWRHLVYDVTEAFFPYYKSFRQWLPALIRAYLVMAGFLAFPFLFTAAAENRRRLFPAWGAAFLGMAFAAGAMPWFLRGIPSVYIDLAVVASYVPAALVVRKTILVRHTARCWIFLWFLWVNLTWQTVQGWAIRPLHAGFDDQPGSVIADLRATPPSRRVLWEDRRMFAHLVDALPALADREYVGVPAAAVHLRQSRDTEWTAPWHGRRALLFRRPLASYKREDLRDALRLYNVGAVVAFSPEARTFLDGFPDLVTAVGRDASGEAAPFAPHQTYLVRDAADPRPGGATVERIAGGLRVTARESGTLSLKYHWIPGLADAGGAQVSPLAVKDKKAPFIALREVSAGRHDIRLAAPE